MTAVFITVYRQRTQPKINEERSVQGQINQIILVVLISNSVLMSRPVLLSLSLELNIMWYYCLEPKNVPFLIDKTFSQVW